MVSANINTDGTTTFFVKDTDSVLMTLTAQLLSVLKRDFGENWAENYPVPVRPLAEQDGLAYFLIYPSDVQYDPADEQARRAVLKRCSRPRSAFPPRIWCWMPTCMTPRSMSGAI